MLFWRPARRDPGWNGLPARFARGAGPFARGTINMKREQTTDRNNTEIVRIGDVVGRNLQIEDKDIVVVGLAKTHACERV